MLVRADTVKRVEKLQAQRSLEQAYSELGKSKRAPEIINANNRFFSILSHEIRTPMTAITSSTEVLKQGDEKSSDERRAIHFKNIQSAISRIQGLIDGVTLVTQSEQGKLPFDPQPIDFKTFCQSTIEQLEAYRVNLRPSQFGSFQAATVWVLNEHVCGRGQQQAELVGQ